MSRSHPRTKFRSGFSPLMAGVHVAPFPDPNHFGWPVEQATDSYAFLMHELGMKP